MKANEFIKKYGINVARNHVEILQEIQINNNYQEYIDELKRLVDSHDLIRKVSGINKAKEILSEIEVGDYADCLKQAIADVESCQ